MRWDSDCATQAELWSVDRLRRDPSSLVRKTKDIREVCRHTKATVTQSREPNGPGSQKTLDWRFQ
jgi:hypothetical protein